MAPLQYPYTQTFNMSAARLEFEDGAVLTVAANTFPRPFQATIDKHAGQAVGGSNPVSDVYSVDVDAAPAQNDAVSWEVPATESGVNVKVYRNPLYPDINGWHPTNDRVRLGSTTATARLDQFLTWEVAQR